MIGRIQGILLEKQGQQVLVDVNGVAYEIEVPLSTFFRLPALQGGLILHTHLVVREDAQLLYGFSELKERSLFRVLIRINGVGPKLGIGILSGMSVDELVACVQGDDLNALVRLPGVGKKTAERLLIELRDKLKDWAPDTSAGAQGETNVSRGSSHHIQEAEAALISLGYKAQQAARAIASAAKQLDADEKEQDSEALIRLALKNMS